jgi:polysaccharide biosynthesis protein PslL
MQKRVDLIDVAKGMSILFVAFHHSQLAATYSEVSSAMGLFRMPLFFFLSGVFFKAVAAPGEFFRHKTEALLKPYFATLGLLLLTTILLGHEGALNEALGIFYGTGRTIRWAPLWFLTLLWVLFMGSYGLVRGFRLDTRPGSVQLLVLLGLLGFGVFWMGLFKATEVGVFGQRYTLPGLPFSIDLIFISMAFFMAGHFLSQQVKQFTPNLWLVVGMGVLFFSVVLFSEASIDLNCRVYQEPVLATLGALSGIYLVLSCAYFFSQVSGIKGLFKLFGSASLFILIFHDFLLHKSQAWFDHWIAPEWGLLGATAAYGISVTLPLLIKTVIERNRFLRPLYFPVKRVRAQNIAEMPAVAVNKMSSG